MNELEIVINPYNSTARVNINDRPISPYSELSKYLKEPFYTWCDKALDVVSRELNDEFNLTIISRQAEAYLLKGLANNYDDCVDFRHKNSTIDISMLNRFKKLSQIAETTKMEIESKLFCVNVFIANGSAEAAINKHFKSSDMLQQNESNTFRAIDYPLCGISFDIEEYTEELFKENIEGISFVVASSNENAKTIYNQIKKYNTSAFILVNNNGFGVEKLNNTFICEYEENRLVATLLELIEFRWITPFYSMLLSKVSEEISTDKVEALAELKMLSSVDPFISVHIIEQLEVNTSAPLIIRSYPENAEVPQLNYKFSKEKIVSCDGKNILALAAGEVDVEVYIQGSLEPISKFHISVIQRNKIKKIELDKENYIMGIQDVLKLSYRFSPENADNQSALQWTSSDSTVATVDKNGNIVALRVGTCYIKISTEDISASCLISVKPKITDIKLSKKEINLYVGETTELNVEFYPVDVINNEVLWETNDKNVAIFENGTVKATGLGKASITFYTPDRSVSSSCQAIVKSTFEKKEYKNNSLSGAVIAFILSILLSSISIINIVIPLVGALLGLLAIKHNEKDKGTATLFIALNIGMIVIKFISF